METDTFFVLGMGNIGRILVTRLKIAGVSSKRIMVYDTDTKRLDAAVEEFGVQPVTPNDDALYGVDVWLLAPPPKVIPDFLRQVAPRITSKQVVVSFAAALPLEKLQTLIPGIPLVRILPNAPSLIGKGMNPVTWGAMVTPKAKEEVQFVLKALGQSLETPDGRMNWCVGLTGAMMRSLLPVLEGMIQGGLEAGFTGIEARRLSAQAMLGTAALLLETDLSIDALKALTPMQTLDEAALARVILDAVRSCYEKTEVNQKKLLEMTGL
jgi:pyrroline-5-carboxylate reductase